MPMRALDPELVSLGVAFSTQQQRVFLRAYPAPAAPPFNTQIALTFADAHALARQLAALLHYSGLPWHQLYPQADDLPDETRWPA